LHAPMATDTHKRSRIEARRAFALHLEGHIETAIEGYRAALALDPGMARAWFARGCAELARDGCAEAERCFRRALTLRPGWAMAHLDLGRALFGLGLVDDALDCVRRAASTTRNLDLRREALRFAAVIVPGASGADPRAVLEQRRAWSRIAALSHAPTAPARRGRARSHGKLRVGYVSAFFGAANWMKPVWGVLHHHDRAAVEVHLFADGADALASSEFRVHSDDVVHDITRLSNARVARRVARAGIDVLVDLNAYSWPRRLGLFMLRPAPAVVGWFNAYATMGIDAFDYLIGDSCVVPEAEACAYPERILRVPGSYLAFSVLYDCPEVAPPPCVERRQLTFGSFCSQYKMTDDVVSAWSAILREVPDARLLVKNRALNDASNRSSFLRRFVRRRVDPSQIAFEGPSEHGAFLAAYAEVDIALDTFPYSGGTTTMEALWQGVPVLTIDGDRWAARTSCSILLAAGFDDWCMPNRDRYVERAIALACDPQTPENLSLLRKTMRQRLRGSPACDSRGLARALEEIYRLIAAGSTSSTKRAPNPRRGTSGNRPRRVTRS
jgi:predicted O-linked N-acetylglucosamine transferase (SPINDLY family)